MKRDEPNNSSPQSIALFGSTGSIGCSTLDIAASHPAKFKIHALGAHRNVELLARQCEQFNPAVALIAEPSLEPKLEALLRSLNCATQVQSGSASFEEVAGSEEVDTVVAAIVGAAGLPSTMAAVNAGKKVLLANKETLVVAGQLFIRAVQQSGAVLLPIDSEHNAIFQCLPLAHCLDQDRLSLAEQGVRRLLLTGSGGPFRTWDLADLSAVTPEQACAHPNWSMGKKISVDSATMMNKGLELIEACWLFNCTPDDIDIVIHPQSVIHSMVEFQDGSTLAQLGSPDMRTPIAHALAWPERVETNVQRLDWKTIGQLQFEPPDERKFPALKLAAAVARADNTAAVALNAANEEAVDAFLSGRIKYLDIVQITQQLVDEMNHVEPESIAQLQEIDSEARRYAKILIEKLA